MHGSPALHHPDPVGDKSRKAPSKKYRLDSMDSAQVILVLKQKNEKADSTRRSSQAVPHPSTNRALCRLTSEVRRDPVHSTRYGRRRSQQLACQSFTSAQGCKVFQESAGCKARQRKPTEAEQSQAKARHGLADCRMRGLIGSSTLDKMHRIFD